VCVCMLCVCVCVCVRAREEVCKAHNITDHQQAVNDAVLVKEAKNDVTEEPDAAAADRPEEHSQSSDSAELPKDDL